MYWTTLTLLLAFAAAPPARDSGVTLDAAFPANVRTDLKVLADDCLAACRQMWPGKPPAGDRPIVLSHRVAGPLLDGTTDGNIYRIFVSVRDRSYSQFVFQFSHEFAHVMLDARRTNGLVETFATAFSLVMLDEMAVRWRKQAPFSNWTSYAPHFRSYRRDTQQRHLKTFPLPVQALVERKAWTDLALYLRYRRGDQDANATNRDLNQLGAIALLSAEVNWKDLSGAAGHTDPPPSRDGRFRADLQLDAGKLPAVVQRLGRNRDSDMAAVELAHKPAGAAGLVLQLGAGRWLFLYEAATIDGKTLGRIIEEMKPIAFRWERGARR